VRREERHRRHERVGEQKRFHRVRHPHDGVALGGEGAAERRFDEKEGEEE